MRWPRRLKSRAEAPDCGETPPADGQTAASGPAWGLASTRAALWSWSFPGQGPQTRQPVPCNPRPIRLRRWHRLGTVPCTRGWRGGKGPAVPRRASGISVACSGPRHQAALHASPVPSRSGLWEAVLAASELLRLLPWIQGAAAGLTTHLPCRRLRGGPGPAPPPLSVPNRNCCSTQR